MKIISNFIPQSRYEKRLGNIERFKDKPITIFNDKPASITHIQSNHSHPRIPYSLTLPKLIKDKVRSTVPNFSFSN